MQKDSEDTYCRVMAKKDRYMSNTKHAEKKTPTPAWTKTNPIFFDATPANFPALNTSDNSPGQFQHTAENTSIASVKTTPTKTAQTVISTDVDTLVSRFDTIASQYSLALEKLMTESREQRLLDKKLMDERRAEDKKAH